jgi:hypothetical protein
MHSASHHHGSIVPPITARRIGLYESGNAVHVGPPSIFANPFQRIGISQARSVILFRAWLAGEATPGVLRCARFSEAEIAALERRRPVVLRRLREIVGKDLRCNCPPWETWCHALTLISLASSTQGSC